MINDKYYLMGDFEINMTKENISISLENSQRKKILLSINPSTTKPCTTILLNIYLASLVPAKVGVKASFKHDE
jgi:hypothetical protein